MLLSYPGFVPNRRMVIDPFAPNRTNGRARRPDRRESGNMRLLRVYHAAPEWQCARAGRILVTGCLLLTSATGYGADSVSPEQRLEHKGIEAEPSSHMTKRTNSETSTAHLASERTEAASGRGRSLSDGQTVGAAQGRVRKIVVSERVRAVGWVGLEGSGHHYMWAAIADMYETSGIDTLPSGNIGQLSLRRSMTAVGESEIRRLMKELADAEKSIKVRAAPAEEDLFVLVRCGVNERTRLADLFSGRDLTDVSSTCLRLYNRCERVIHPFLHLIEGDGGDL